MAVALDLTNGTASCTGTEDNEVFTIASGDIVDVSDYDALDVVIHVESVTGTYTGPITISVITGMAKPISGNPWPSIASVELTSGESIPAVQLAAGCGLLKYLGWRVRGVDTGVVVEFSVGGMLRELGR